MTAAERLGPAGADADDGASAMLRHRGTRAIQRMVEFAPSTGGLALWVHHRDRASADDGPGTPPVATDGATLFYAGAFEALPVAEQAGLVAHEVLHIALRHTQRYTELQQLIGDVDLRLYTICADAIVNSTLGALTWLRLPAGAVTLEALLASALRLTRSAEVALLEWDVERLYRAIDDRRAAPRGGRSRQRDGGQGGGGKADQPQPGAGGAASERDDDQATGQDQKRPDGPRAACARALGARSLADLMPGADALAERPEDEAEQAREWSERLTRAHAGDGAHSMLRALIADLPRSRTPWEQVLRTLLARALAPKPEVSWSRPSRSYLANQGRCGTRRMPWEPGISPTKAVPRLVVVVDVSGSIDEPLMARFAREVEALTRRLESALTLVVGDDKVQRVAQFEPGRSDLREIAFQGGGGTDFTPLLEEADRHRPDIGIVLTDLDGPTRFTPRWPVIWAVPEAYAAMPEPFGRKLVLR
jgi:predicted metal-dependent peptidase